MSSNDDLLDALRYSVAAGSTFTGRGYGKSVMQMQRFPKAVSYTEPKGEFDAEAHAVSLKALRIKIAKLRLTDNKLDKDFIEHVEKLPTNKWAPLLQAHALLDDPTAMAEWVFGESFRRMREIKFSAMKDIDKICGIETRAMFIDEITNYSKPREPRKEKAAVSRPAAVYPRRVSSDPHRVSKSKARGRSW